MKFIYIFYVALLTFTFDKVFCNQDYNVFKTTNKELSIVKDLVEYGYNVNVYIDEQFDSLENNTQRLITIDNKFENVDMVFAEDLLNDDDIFDEVDNNDIIDGNVVVNNLLENDNLNESYHVDVENLHDDVKKMNKTQFLNFGGLLYNDFYNYLNKYDDSMIRFKYNAVKLSSRENINDRGNEIFVCNDCEYSL